MGKERPIEKCRFRGLSQLNPSAFQQLGVLMFSQLFTFTDRKDTRFLLGPTHEEEITSLAAKTLKSYKELPLRLYQITRKYRDEFRPRHGLLRGREFTMKDLYTFDGSVQAALETYEQVRQAYNNIFSELKLPVLAAKASSGDMGGDLSHEYHLPTAIGDDRVIHCNTCDYVINEEIAESTVAGEAAAEVKLGLWRGISKDRTTLINVWYPRKMIRPRDGQLQEYTDADIRISAIKALVPDLDTAIGDALPLWRLSTSSPTMTAARLVNITDHRLGPSVAKDIRDGTIKLSAWPTELEPQPQSLSFTVHGTGSDADKHLDVLRVQTGDQCPQCRSGTLTVEKAIELGHTFHLGTRYSEVLGPRMAVPPSSDVAPLQMGCHGIGISRIIGAMAEHMGDNRGLNWPAVIAPYSCVIVPGGKVDDGDALGVYATITDSAGDLCETLDAVLDDRDRSLPWKLKDADLVGFPVIVVLGRDWHESKYVEVQCRRLGVKEKIGLDALPRMITKLHKAI